MGVTSISRKGRSNFYFSDKQMSFNHDIRVFIFGAEVTKHIRGSVTVVRNDRTSPGTLSFDLDNVNDIFTLTPRNKGYKVDSDGNYFKDKDAGSIDVGDALTENAKKSAQDISNKISKAQSELDALQASYNKEADNLESYREQMSTLNKNSAKWKSLNNKAKASEKAMKSTKVALDKKQKEYDSLVSRQDVLMGNISKDGNSYKLTGTFDSNSSSRINETRSSRAKSNANLISKELIKTLQNDDLFTDGLYSDSAKQLVYTNKSLINADIISGAVKLNFTKGFKPYSLSINSPIFEKNDPIRVFIKDPSVPFDEKDKWAPFFTGFIQNITDHTNYENGEKYMTVLCYDIRGLMQKQRVMTNPRISHGMDTALQLNQNVIGDKNRIGLFGDYIAHSGSGGEKGTKYTYSKADESILDMVTGRVHSDDNFEKNIIGNIVSTQSNLIVDESLGKYNLNVVNSGSSAGGTRPGKQSMGCFMPGLVLECPSYKDEKESHIKAMELWYDLLVFGTKCDYFTEDEVTFVGSKTIPYGEFDPYNGWLHLLVPKNGTGARAAFSSQLDDLSSQYEFENRFQLLTRLCEALDYQWFCNAMGDIVVEFPMYDFVLDSFGAYADQLRIDNHLVDCQLNEIVDDVVTAMSVSGGVSHSNTTPDEEISWVYTALAKSDALAFKYGVTVEEFTIPTMRTNTSQDSLKRQAVIELVKRNVLASSMEMTVAYRWAFFPNKPIYNVDKNRMGVISAFTYTFQVNESVSVSMDVRYIRKKLEDNTFIHIFNGDSMPIKYLTSKNNEVDTSGLDTTTSGIDVFLIK